MIHSCRDRVIHCTWVYPLDDFPPFFGYYFFNVMLTVLLVLHVYWAFLILRMFYKLLSGKVRSSLFCACLSPSNSLRTRLFVFCFNVPCSWKVMTGVTKRRTTPMEHRWNKSPDRVTSAALDSEAEQTVTDASGGREQRKTGD